MPNFRWGVRGGGSSSRLKEPFEVEDGQEKINAACSSLIEIGFSPKLFTVKNLRNFGYTEVEFLEFIGPISSVTNLDDLRRLFDIARESVFLTSSIITPNEFRMFVHCVKWLNGELAKKNLADELLEKKNPQKKKEMSKADVALAEMLLDYAATDFRERKRIESEIDELKNRQKDLETESASIGVDYAALQEHKRIKIDIDELKKRQKDLEAESASITNYLKEMLGPIYDYEEPSLTELRTEAYKIYVTDCRSKGITVTPELDEMGYAKVEDVFGGIVKERHFIKFLNDPVRREIIENYFKEYAGGGD